jgi:predicted O-methyltransferase YrrM
MVMIDLPSSYGENNLGSVLHNLVMDHHPKHIVEFGVFHGYSTIHMALALQRLGRGTINGYDLWDKYPFRHVAEDDAWDNIVKFGVDDVVKLDQVDFFEWLKNPEPFDMLHLDISNNGDTIERALTALQPQIEAGAIVVFEGGSVERDNCEWMKKYNMPPINPLQEKFNFTILDDKFPSISLVEHKA